MSGLTIATSAATEEKRGIVFSGRFFLAAAMLLLLIGSQLRVFRLGQRSLWYDEAVTANASAGTLSDALAQTQQFSAPVVHPAILCLAEKVGKGAAAVRIPSLVASILAIFMMLAMVRVKVSHHAALFAAAILAVSASQIRYAQEVREYSLAVLLATILIYSLFQWEAESSPRAHPIALYAALFAAPLIQYGLVFLAVAILSTIVLRLLLTRGSSFSLSRAIIAAASLAAGALVSYDLTLRHQFHLGRTPWYLAGNYYGQKAQNFLVFFGENSIGLLRFLIPGRLIDVCFVVCAIVCCVLQIRRRRYNTITLLIVSCVLINLCASVARVYPYGGVRQCLFLAPVFALFAGVNFADLADRVKGSLRPFAIFGVMAVIVLSLLRGVLKEWPYGEIEDTQSVLRELGKSMAANDQVWVNHDAVAAFQFYLKKKNPRFVYGTFHPNADEYVPELLGSIDPDSERLWLVFSHLEQASDRAEQKLIVRSLSPGWDVQSVIVATNAELYVAQRKTSP